MISFNPQNFKNVKKLLTFKTILALLALALLLLLMYHCPFSYIIGISCPGCGMTRSLISALRFDIAKAFYFHPLWWLIIIFAIGALLERISVITLSPRLRNIICGFVATALFVVYFIRLFSGSDIVSIHFEEGLLYQLFN